MRTRWMTLAVAALALAACSDQSTTPAAPAEPRGAAPLRLAASGGVEGEYIVVLRKGADPRAVAAVAGVSPRFVYTVSLTGFAASLNAGQLNALRHLPAVEYVEQDQVGGPAAVTETPASWGLDR
ncbi:MAG TPA: protease inhibitor I9 family protein, partial [Longimicrobium sp.]|nr:protease inhibitor I9 family protein [Longimicrobium sp.]